ALLNSRSRRPKAFFVLANSAFTEAGLLTSVGTTSARPPRRSTSFAVASRGLRWRPARTRQYPPSARARLACLPIPLPAPVMIATFLEDFMLAPIRPCGLAEPYDRTERSNTQ